MIFLGIDTSNYTTSMAAADGSKVIFNGRIVLEVGRGNKGLRQNDAVFLHIRNLPRLAERLGNIAFTAIGYSAYPRDAASSYMPCFEAGAAAARCLAALNGIPSYPFSHQAGHVAAAVYSAGAENIKASPYLAFHVSGGTTELLFIRDGIITIAGKTHDLNAGQLIDRTGLMLGLDFPCGPALEKLAGSVTPPKPKICVHGLDCNLSGAENQIAGMVQKGIAPEITAAFAIEFIKLTIDALTKNALEHYGPVPVLYAGGVMSNRTIRDYIKSRYHAYFADPEYSCDNAAGIALLCREAYLKNR